MRCIICNTILEYGKHKIKTCSKQCNFKLISIRHIESFLVHGRGYSVKNKTEIYITPQGIYKSTKLAAVANNVSSPTIRARCKNCNHIIKYNSGIPKDWSGKSWKELGWSYQTIS